MFVVHLSFTIMNTLVRYMNKRIRSVHANVLVSSRSSIVPCGWARLHLNQFVPLVIIQMGHRRFGCDFVGVKNHGSRLRQVNLFSMHVRPGWLHERTRGLYWFGQE